MRSVAGLIGELSERFYSGPWGSESLVEEFIWQIGKLPDSYLSYNQLHPDVCFADGILVDARPFGAKRYQVGYACFTRVPCRGLSASVGVFSLP